MEIEAVLVLAMLVSFVVLLFLGLPVAWVFGGVGILFAGVGYLADEYLDAATGLDYNTLGLVVGRIFAIMDNWVLVAVPMFVLMGLTLEKSGVAARMLGSMQRLFGGVHGGLALSVMVVGILLAASTGIIGASVVLLGTLSLPLMLRQGYSTPLALGTVAGAGCLGILLPPSIMLVVMGDQLALSVGDLFMGAVFPGLILSGLYIVYIVAVGMLRPAAAPLPPRTDGSGSNEVLVLLWDTLPTAALMVAVLGSIFAGIATVTEASGIGAAGALLLAAVYRRLDLTVLREVVMKAFSTTAYIFAIFVGATVFSLVLRELGGDDLIEELLMGLELGPQGLVVAVLVAVFLLGFLLDWIEITLILLPLLAPVIIGLDLGVEGYGEVDQPGLVWFTLLVALTLQTSFLTPPVGFALFYLKGVCPPEVRLSQIYQGVAPFILLQLIALVVVFLFPSLVTWLPAVAYGE